MDTSTNGSLVHCRIVSILAGWQDVLSVMSCIAWYTPGRIHSRCEYSDSMDSDPSYKLMLPDHLVSLLLLQTPRALSSLGILLDCNVNC